MSPNCSVISFHNKVFEFKRLQSSSARVATFLISLNKSQNSSKILYSTVGIYSVLFYGYLRLLHQLPHLVDAVILLSVVAAQRIED